MKKYYLRTLVIFISVLLLMLIVFNLNFVKNLAEILVSNNQVLQAIVNIIAIISGIGGIIIGVASFRISSLEAVKEYFSQGDTAEMKERRKYIYDKVKNGEKIGPDDLNASVVCSYFHFWGLMVKKRYLPISGFLKVLRELRC